MSTTMIRLGTTILAASAIAVAAGCGGSPAQPSAPSTPTNSFAQQVQAEILTPACSGCHTDVGRNPAGGLNLKDAATSYASLVGVASTGKPGAIRVIANDPTNSYLVQKLEGAAGIVGLRMPRNGPPYLPDAQVAQIRLWITNGAKNN